MRNGSLSKLLAVMAMSAVTAPALATGDLSPSASDAYRLNIAEPQSLRLPSPAPAEPAIPPHLADKPYAKMISSAAHKAALDPALVHAVIFVESRYQAAARSPKGAIGLMQVLPETAARYGVANPAKSPEVNLKAGTLYLQDLMQLFDKRVDLALAAYNAGENAVLRHGHRVPPYPETQSYVPAVLAKYREWREPARPAGPPRIEYLPGTRLDLRGSGTPLQ